MVKWDREVEGMQLKLHMVTIENLVPEEHFLRKLEAALDLSFVYHETEKLYSRRYGRPPIDPVALVKYLLVGYLYLRQLEHIHQEIIPIQAAVADAAYDLPLFYRVLRDHGIRFYVRPLPRSVSALGGVPGSPFIYDERSLHMSRREDAASAEPQAQRRRTALGILRGQERLRRLSHERAMRGKGTGQTPGAQLLLERDPGGFERTGQPDVPEGPGQAADLERGHLCRTEVGAQAWPSPATRLRGSGGPLPLVSDRRPH